MPDVHLPHLEEDEHDAADHVVAPPAPPRRRWTPLLRIGLEVVRKEHERELKDLQAYLTAHTGEIVAHMVDVAKPIPMPIPDNETDAAGVDFAAWDFALATQSLAYIDPDLVASMSSAYRLQQVYLDAHRSIQQTSYAITNFSIWLNGVTTYFGDALGYKNCC